MGIILSTVIEERICSPREKPIKVIETPWKDITRFLNSLKFGAMDRFLLTFVVVAILSTSTHVGGKALDERIDDIELRSGCVGYQEEVTAYWCDDNSDCNGDYKDYKGICNGSKTDCVAKGKEKCLSDPSCFGIMYHAGAKALKVCTSKRLVVKPERDWDVYMKCEEHCNVGDVKLEKDGTPMLFWKEKWSPICGHYFWDNQHGANTFCKKLGSPSGKQERASAKYGEESIQIGRCNKDVDLTECTKKKSYCHAGDKVAIRITCEGLKSDTVSSSCGATATTGVIPTTVPTTTAVVELMKALMKALMKCSNEVVGDVNN